MKSWSKILALTSVIALSLAATDLMAQGGGGGFGGGGGGGGGGFGGGGGGGGFGGGGGGGRGRQTPEQIRQNRLDTLKAALEVTDDTEWTALSTAIGKVMDAQQAYDQAVPRAAGGFGGRGGRRNGGGAGGPGGGGAGGPGGGGAGGGGFGGGGAGGFGGVAPVVIPEREALQAAIDAKAPADEIKTKLGAFRKLIADRQDALTSAQTALTKLLTQRQEGIAVLNGLLK